MSRRFKVWLDSGANHASCREDEISLDDFGMSSDEWDALSDKEKEDLMRDFAWEYMDWGFAEIEEKDQPHEH